MDVRFHPRLADIDAAAWNALRPDDSPFLSHAFLEGLERTGCIRSHWGWQPHHLGLYRDGALIGAAPLYLKGNSHGEFVFDWAWAAAYERSGRDYYPKLLAAVPYSPVSGPRLLAGTSPDPAVQRHLIEAIRGECDRRQLSTAHVNFLQPRDVELFDTPHWLARSDWQFHWHNRAYRDFDDFLDALTHKKRKNIRQERALVARSGVHAQIVQGDELDDAMWRFLHTCYCTTFQEKGNHPALTADFFRHLGQHLPRNVVAIIGYRGATPIAAALCLRDATTLYGRYWGCLETVPGLHFELCYYQGIDYCIRHGLQRFEPGAQGEHKLARGFLPRRTRSFHYVADLRFRQAIADALRHEARAISDYGAELERHSPYADHVCHGAPSDPPEFP
ncbi:GNAT family N-acetyltransferase [Tahibacter amnicola]|uniref:GNAT family N-acetyltransferase n=1 Tax=Tahibacter amnicola TaxID=2976241 RepID=A0ABY6BK84_9GAMM|nr:GNAT family N-acetyltransferase [Tahibacter amnicola]UXI70021.1 GNAT family N-acetyltransferase [Tahibacter amnicola]